jgi:RNA polymerase sigma-70 factor (ECF subfamily)
MHNDARLVQALRNGDEAAFGTLFDQYHTSLVRTALIYVNNPTAAEEVAQETWIAVFKGINRFEGRSSLKTWIFSILVNRAKTHAQREGRYAALNIAWDDPEDSDSTAEQFWPSGHQWADHWMSAPRRWDSLPEEQHLSRELRGCIEQAIAELSPNQRLVITLRDVERLSSEEVCNVLGVTDTNQRVLLHRARARVRQAVETYLSE